MLALRSPFVRLLVTVVLLCFLSISVFLIRNIVLAAWRQDQQEEAWYLRAPNCFPHQDPSEVDASLPPCQNVTLTVIAKPQKTTVDHYRNRDYPTTHRLLTLQDGTGKTQTVGDIPRDMWDSLKVGDPVSATLWQSRVRDVTANGYRSSIFDKKKWDRAEAAAWPWIIIALACSCSLSLLWRGGRLN